MIRSVRAFVGGLAVACALGCGDDGGDGNAPSGQGGGGGMSVSFAQDVHPILQAKCGDSGCHDTPNLFQPGHGAGDVDVAYEAATGVGALGEPVYDRILVRISATDPSFIMPPERAGCMGGLGQPGCITQAEYELIESWVAQGRPR